MAESNNHTNLNKVTASSDESKDQISRYLNHDQPKDEKDLDQKEAEEQIRQKQQKLEEEERQKEEDIESEKKKKEKSAKKETQEKEEKRLQIIEKSRQILDEFKERDHSELSQLQIVQLIVAERISWLGDRLEDSEHQSEQDIQATNLQLDFLGSLAHKLIEPDLEVSLGVEEVYQKIIQDISIPHSAEGSQPNQDDLHEHIETTSDRVLRSLADNIHPEDECLIPNPEANKDITDQHHAHSEAIALSITSLALACKKLHHSRKPASGTSYSSPDSGPSSQTKESKSRPVLAPARAPRTPQPVVPNEARTTRTITPLALATSMRQSRDNAPARSSDQQLQKRVEQSSPRQTQQPHEPTITSEASIGRTTQNYTAGISPIDTRRLTRPLATDTPELSASKPLAEMAIQAQPQEEMTTSSLPIEKWRLEDMLKVAHQIPVGHSNNLRNAFARGEIDQEGLIRVIKDWKRGVPYTSTFESQRLVNKSRQSAMTPERPTVSHNNVPPQTSQQNYQKSPQVSSHQFDANNSDQVGSGTNLASNVLFPELSTEKPQQSDEKNWTLIATVCLLLIVAVIVIILTL